MISEIQLGQKGVTNLTIDGTGADITVDGGHSTRIFEVLAGINGTINNLVLADGYGWFAPGNNKDGGAVLVDANATLNLTCDKFNVNEAGNENNSASGGAVANLGTLNIVDTSFISNTANANGGAIDNLGVLNISGNNNNFAVNTAGQNGGAIYSDDSDSSSGSGSGSSGGGTSGTGSGGSGGSTSGTGSGGGSGGTSGTGVGGGGGSTSSTSIGSGGGGTSGTGFGWGGGGGVTFTSVGGGVGNTIPTGGASSSSYSGSGRTGIKERVGSNQGAGLYTTAPSLAIPSSAPSGGGAVTLSVGGATFQDNTAQKGNGGAIENSAGGLKVSSSYFYGNSAISGGAIDTSDVTILTNVIFGGTQQGQLNTANGGNGGAVQSALSATLTNVQFIGNQALTNANGQNGNGGAIENATNAVLIVTQSLFQGNTAQGNGGAIENLGSTKIADNGTYSAFLNNLAANNGGAIDSSNGSPTGQLIVQSSTFWGNQAIGGSGGTINTLDDTQVTGTQFGSMQAGDENTAKSSGGAIEANPGADNPDATLYVANCQFARNLALVSGFGGAISTSDDTTVSTTSFLQNRAVFGGAIAYVIANDGDDFQFSSTLLVTSDYFWTNGPRDNGLTGLGGAIYSDVDNNSGTVSVNILASSFEQNGKTAGVPPFPQTLVSNGGGVDIVHKTSGNGSASATLTNDTFYKNFASDHGGGIALQLTNTGTGLNTAQLTSLTVNQNQSGIDSGGLYVDAAQQKVVSVDNNIFDGNSVTAAGYNGPIDVTLAAGTTLNDVGYNLVGLSDTMFNVNNNDIFNNAPGLANALAGNNARPGFTLTLALLAGSPAIGTGDPNLAGTIDGRGRTRQAKVSIGAYDPNAL